MVIDQFQLVGVVQAASRKIRPWQESTNVNTSASNALLTALRDAHRSNCSLARQNMSREPGFGTLRGTFRDSPSKDGPRLHLTGLSGFLGPLLVDSTGNAVPKAFEGLAHYRPISFCKAGIDWCRFQCNLPLVLRWTHPGLAPIGTDRESVRCLRCRRPSGYPQQWRSYPACSTSR